MSGQLDTLPTTVLELLRMLHQSKISNLFFFHAHPTSLTLKLCARSCVRLLVDDVAPRLSCLAHFPRVAAPTPIPMPDEVGGPAGTPKHAALDFQLYVAVEVNLTKIVDCSAFLCFFQADQGSGEPDSYSTFASASPSKGQSGGVFVGCACTKTRILDDRIATPQNRRVTLKQDWQNKPHS